MLYRKKVFKLVILVMVLAIIPPLVIRIRNKIKLRKESSNRTAVIKSILVRKAVKTVTNQRLFFLGKLLPKSEFFIYPDIRGQAIVRKIFYDEGDSVAKDAVLMALDQSFTTNEFYNPYKVRSQSKGIVANRFVEVGDKVNALTPLFNIVDISQVRVTIDIPEKYLGQIEKGQQIIIRVKNGIKTPSQDTFIGKIDYLNPVSTFNRHNIVRAISIIDNTDLRLKSGYFVDVEILIAEKELMLVPTRSIIFENNLYSIFVYDSTTQKVFLRAVKIGDFLGEQIQILSGLKEGDFFLIKGQTFVFDGQTVKAELDDSKKGIEFER